MPSEKTLNLPNSITVLRFFLGIIVFAMIDRGGWWIATAVLFVIAVATDVLDGYIARKYNIVTTFGRIVDPFVDSSLRQECFCFCSPSASNPVSQPGW